MEPISCKCFTNLDEYAREEWPTQLAVRPIEGDRVMAKSGRSLKIVGITHVDAGAGPYLRIELNK